jgi:hypothetical protein
MLVLKNNFSPYDDVIKCRLCLKGCVFTLSFALIAAAEINSSVPMILVGRIIGGLAVGKRI